MKKSPSQITDEELLKLLDTLEESDVVEPSFDNSILALVHSFNLKPGKSRIAKKQLYNLYLIWNKSAEKISFRQFTFEVSKYFEHKSYYFYIDNDLFDIAKFINTEVVRHTQEKSKSKYWHKHFTEFLTDTKLEEGTIFIELEILYFLYLQWTKLSRKKVLLARRQFIKVLDLYFDIKAIGLGSHLWVGLNEQIKNLITKQEIERWRKHRDKKTKKTYYPKKEWKKFALYWEKKEK